MLLYNFKSVKQLIENLQYNHCITRAAWHSMCVELLTSKGAF